MVVSLAPPPSISVEEEDRVHVVLGYCGTSTLDEEGPPELMALGLGNPDWETSLELVSRLYPGGTAIAGLCWRQGIGEGVGLEEELEHTMRLHDVLMRTTNLKVSI